jgi:hypothetical protein
MFKGSQTNVFVAETFHSTLLLPLSQAFLNHWLSLQTVAFEYSSLTLSPGFSAKLPLSKHVPNGPIRQENHTRKELLLQLQFQIFRFLLNIRAMFPPFSTGIVFTGKYFPRAGGAGTFTTPKYASFNAEQWRDKLGQSR